MTLNFPQRVLRFERVVATYADDSECTNLVELLTDALHWCHVEAVTFDNMLDRARSVFTAQIGDAPKPSQTPHGDTDGELSDLLTKRRQIASIWGIDDVQSVRPYLDDDQAWAVLQHIDGGQNADIGINWDTIEHFAEELFGPGNSNQ